MPPQLQFTSHNSTLWTGFPIIYSYYSKMDVIGFKGIQGSNECQLSKTLISYSKKFNLQMDFNSKMSISHKRRV